MTAPIAFLYLHGNLTSNDDSTKGANDYNKMGEAGRTADNAFLVLYLLIPGVIVSVLIRMFTKKTQHSPTMIFINGAIGIVMSTIWIIFITDILVDLL